MKITICGSKEMIDAKNQLEKMGHICFIPEGVYDYAENKVKKVGGSEGARRKIANDLIRRHYNLINNSDAILVLNFEKNGIKNYIGGNTLIEMGQAYVNNKKIFLLNTIPDMQYKEEIEALQPIVINNDLSKIN